MVNSILVEAHKSFQFFREITWFLGNNRALLLFRYPILHNLISITKINITLIENEFYKMHTLPKKAKVVPCIQSLSLSAKEAAF